MTTPVPTEYEYRNCALEHAVRASPRETPTADIVNRAAEFLTFLKTK